MAPARLVAVLGMGIRMYATQLLVAGEIIFTEHALLLTSLLIFTMTEMLPGAIQTEEAQRQHVLDDCEQLLQVTMLRMPPATLAAYHALANSHECYGCGPLLDVQCTDMWGIEPYAWWQIIPTFPDNKELQDGGICEVLSRINHSCSPNAAVVFHMPSFSFVLSMLCDIPTGAEITSPYTAICAPAAMCQQCLQPWDIEMACAEDEAGIRAWVEDALLSDDALSHRSLHMLQLIEEEGMQIVPAYEEHLTQLAAVYVALGEREQYLAVQVKALHWMQ